MTRRAIVRARNRALYAAGLIVAVPVLALAGILALVGGAITCLTDIDDMETSR